VADPVASKGGQQGSLAHPGGRQRRFASGVPAANYDYVETVSHGYVDNRVGLR
jgi:hypothetical protein